MAEAFLSDGILQHTYQQADRTAVSSAGNRTEVGAEAGISYYEYAERPGGTAGIFDHGCSERRSVTARSAVR